MGCGSRLRCTVVSGVPAVSHAIGDGTPKADSCGQPALPSKCCQLVGDGGSVGVLFVVLGFGERRLSEGAEPLREKNCWCTIYSQTVSRTGLPITPCSPFSRRPSPIVEKRSVTALLDTGLLRTPYASSGRPVSRTPPPNDHQVSTRQHSPRKLSLGSYIITAIHLAPAFFRYCPAND